MKYCKSLFYLNINFETMDVDFFNMPYFYMSVDINRNNGLLVLTDGLLILTKTMVC